MLKKTVTFEDYDGDEVTETFYFNLSKAELVELEVEFDGGLAKFLQRIIDDGNVANMIEQFKRIVLLSYGVRSEDGKRFIKNDQVREEFTQTAAYSAVFMELATSDQAAAAFLMGVLPKDMAQETQKALDAEATPVETTPSV